MAPLRHTARSTLGDLFSESLHDKLLDAGFFDHDDEGVQVKDFFNRPRTASRKSRTSPTRTTTSRSRSRNGTSSRSPTRSRRTRTSSMSPRTMRTTSTRTTSRATRAALSAPPTPRRPTAAPRRPASWRCSAARPEQLERRPRRVAPARPRRTSAAITSASCCMTDDPGRETLSSMAGRLVTESRGAFIRACCGRSRWAAPRARAPRCRRNAHVDRVPGRRSAGPLRA